MPNSVALIFGAVIVAIFSYERFNQATYAGGRQLERVVSLLSPDKLRARRIVLNAYALYALALLLIYFFLCAYAEVLPLLGGPELAPKIGASTLMPEPAVDRARATAGFTNGAGDAAAEQPSTSDAGSEATKDPAGVPIAASVSLTIALIMVGLAPTFPILRRSEDWLRSTAHRLAGIPTRVIAAAEELRQNALELGVTSKDPIPKDGLLIPRGDWSRMEAYRTASEGKVASPDEFDKDLQLVFAISAWVLDGKLKLVSSKGRARFESLELELGKRKDILIVELDEKSGFGAVGTRRTAKAGGGAAAAGKAKPSAEAAAAAVGRRPGWERLASDADKLADDFCILLALYVEHDVIVGRPSERAHESGQAVIQQNAAGGILLKFLDGVLGDGAASAQVRSRTTIAFFWTFGVVSVVAIVWSLWPGVFEISLQTGEVGVYRRAWKYFNGAFISYCIPVLVVLAIRDAAREANRWQSMVGSHWTLRAPQAALVVFAAWVLATLILVGIALWTHLITRETQVVKSSIWSALQGQFEYNAPSPLRGAVLGLIIAVLLDASITPHRRGPNPKPKAVNSLAWACVAALIMGVTGGATRLLVSVISAAKAGKDSLDSVDRGLIVYTTIYAAIIGFAVVFCVAEALKKRSGGSRAAYAARPEIKAESVAG